MTPSSFSRLHLTAGLLLLGLPLVAQATVGTQNDPVPGWASQNGGTTGGKGGKEVTVKTMADLQKYAKDSNPYIIWVEGTMGSYGKMGEGNGDRVVVASNKSILGLPGSVIKGGFDLSGVKNVIMRNLTVQGPGACDNDCGSAGENRQDNITIVNGTTNVWLDHMDIMDGEDGNTDITKKSDFVTLSWVKFHYTSNSYPSGTTGKSHRFCNLLGGSDNADKEGANNLSVTFYKTWWGEGVAERQPRVRFGKVHVANCLFNSTDAGQTHNVRAGFKANLLIESNVFVGQKKPIDLYNNDFTAVTERNNLFTNCSGNTAGSGTAFTPPYTLKLSSTSGLLAEISDAKNGAGATLVWGTDAIESMRANAPAIRIDRRDNGWVLANGGTSTISAELLGLDGRRSSESFSVNPGAVATLPSSRNVRLVRITGAGERKTLPIPGF